MAGPLAGISAAEITKQLPEQAGQQAGKQGASKFDQALQDNSMQSKHADHAHKAQAVQHAGAVDHAQAVQQVQKTDHARLEKLSAADESRGKNLRDASPPDTQASSTSESSLIDPVTHKAEVSKGTQTMMGLFSNIEKGQAQMDKLINGALNGKNFSNHELLGLQASMYKYSQELELTSKVVEKATSGLKDTLKTQV